MLDVVDRLGQWILMVQVEKPTMGVNRPLASVARENIASPLYDRVIGN